MFTCPGQSQVVNAHIEGHLVEGGRGALWVPDDKRVQAVTWDDVIQGTFVQVRLEAVRLLLDKHLIIF